MCCNFLGPPKSGVLHFHTHPNLIPVTVAKNIGSFSGAPKSDLKNDGNVMECGRTHLLTHPSLKIIRSHILYHKKQNNK